MKIWVIIGLGKIFLKNIEKIWKMNKIQKLIIHHTAVSHRLIPDQFDMVNDYHKQKWGMKSSLGYFGGYNYIISADGSIKQYRADGEETVATTGHNFNTIHVAICGDFTKERPSLAQFIALRVLINNKMREYTIDPDQIRTHRQFKNTSCPGNNITDLEIRQLFAPDMSYIQQMIFKIQTTLNSMKLKLKGRKEEH